MKGDRLASGERSASFAVAPSLHKRYTEGQVHDDLAVLTPEQFVEKHMITEREYNLLLSNYNNPERISSFAEEMNQRAEAAERELAADKAQENKLERPCCIIPFVASGPGRVVVARDRSVSNTTRSNLALPRSLRKEKELLPTTGKIIKAVAFDANGTDVSAEMLGWRVVFSPMSGTAICFKGYPTWILLELSEILAVVIVDDATLVEETLEPMV